MFPPDQPPAAHDGGGVEDQQILSPEFTPEVQVRSPDSKTQALPVADTKRVAIRRKAFAQNASGASGNGIVLGGIGMSFVTSEGRHIVSQFAQHWQGAAQASGLLNIRDIIIAINDHDAPTYANKYQRPDQIVDAENTEVSILLQTGTQAHQL